MKRGLKKKGSSLVAVLVICSIILVTATTMIGVATSDVRMRMNESKKLQNMYKSDSGLEVLYNIILKDTEVAIDYANTKTRQLDYLKGKPVGDISDSEIYNELNTEFQSQFIKALLKTSANSIIIKENSTDTREDVEQDIQDIYKNEKEYVVTKKDGDLVGNSDVNSRLFFSLKNKSYMASIDEGAYVTKFVDGFFGVDEENKPTIKVLNATYNDSKRTITFTVRSSFKCTETSTTKLENKKVVETKFTIVAPEYSEIINRTNSSGTFEIKAPYSNAITADGNVLVNSSTNLSGNIWVKGDAEAAAQENQSFAFSKYNGGIILGNGDNFTVKSTSDGNTSNIYTASTFTLVNNSKVNLSNGNLYSANTYIGPSKTTDSSTQNNSLSVGDMITYNDLGINALNTQVSMNNYYGINDATNNNTNTSSTKESASKNSSCILINNYNGLNKININNNAYIMGVAYIDTGDAQNGEYQTGESIAVKGNYKAYQEALTSIGDNKTTITPGFKYYNPVSLLETINGHAATVQEKKDYFNEYYKNKVFSNGGVNIGGTIYSTGAYVYDTKNNTPESGEIDQQTAVVDKERREYAKKVLSMSTNLDDDSAMTVYNNGTVTKTVKGGNGSSAVVNFDAIPKSVAKISGPAISNGTILSNAYKNWRYVLVKEENEDVVIGDGYIKIGKHASSEDGYSVSMNENVENNGVTGNPEDNKVQAVIITKGNVVIKSGVNFTGTIIAGGNVTIEDGTSDVNISYDSQVVGQIIRANNLDAYFNVADMETKETIITNEGDLLTSDKDTYLYNASNVVNKHLWKLIENKDDK
ncbi:MAG: pilus assembly PilX N-terminal domain-containing protein [Clostridium sp.]|nr:pilus assembly PilX N-terminal domain-containing protein [Clostridium sp.]